MDTGSDIYFATCQSGLVKIGRSSNVTGRMQELRCPDGGSVSLISFIRGVGPYEKTAHRFVEHAALGGEWFYPVEDVMALTRLKSGADLLSHMGVERRISPALAGRLLPGDDKDLDLADQMIAEGKRLRATVLSRIRQRKHRERKAAGGNATA